MSVTRKNGNKGRVKVIIAPAGAVEIPIKGWNMTMTAVAADATTNADAGFDNVTPGNKKATGSVSCLWDKELEGNAIPTSALEAGMEVTLQLFPTPADGSAATGYYSVPAMITEQPISCTQNETIAWSFNFTNQGAWEWVPYSA